MNELNLIIQEKYSFICHIHKAFFNFYLLSDRTVFKESPPCVTLSVSELNPIPLGLNQLTPVFFFRLFIITTR